MKNEIVILGAGISGVGAAILAKSKDKNVFVSEYGNIKEAFKQELIDHQIPFEEGGHNMERILNARLIIKSPGISDEVQAIQIAMKNDIPIWSEIEYAAHHTNSTIIAITGTNGKTTTTHLCYHILKNAGLDVRMVGNIGDSFAKAVAGSPAEYYVVEVSSFQLDHCYQFKPKVAILCNITPDHLDRYDYNLSLYAKAKFRICQNQDTSDFFIYCQDDELTRQYKPQNIASKQLNFSLMEKATAYTENEQLKIELKPNKTFNMNIQQLALQGMHNTYNGMAAAIMAKVLDIKNDHIRDSLMNFENIEHRLEKVATIGGVNYINDSKATNVNSAWYALECTKEPIIWIAGGVDKGNDYSQIKELVRKKVKMIICLGTNNIKIHQAFAGDVEMIMNTTSAVDAVNAAYKLAQKGDTVLLSPACSSFDLFESYEDRGRQFKSAVKAL